MQELEKILKEIREYENHVCNEVKIVGYIAGAKRVIRGVEEIIRKHMNDGWIPVKERLPKDGQFVLTCGESGWMKTAWYNARLNLWDTGPSLADLRADAVAWMPLPEPCRESEVEKDEENM